MDPIKDYYEYLKKAGADVASSIDSFKSTLGDEAVAKEYYSYLKSNKFDAPDTFESFSNTLGLFKKKDGGKSSQISQLQSSSKSLLAKTPDELPLGIPGFTRKEDLQRIEVENARTKISEVLNSSEDIFGKLIKEDRLRQLDQESKSASRMDGFINPALQSAKVGIVKTVPVTKEDIVSKRSEALQDDNLSREIIRRAAKKDKSVAKSVYLVDSEQRAFENPDKVSTILDNAEKISKGELNYNIKRGVLEKPEGEIKSLIRGFNERNKQLEDYNFLTNTLNDDAVISQLEDDRRNIDPDKPVPVAAGTSSQFAEMIGMEGLAMSKGIGTAVVTSAIPGGQAVAPYVAAFASSPEYYKRSYSAALRSAYNELRSKGVPERKALETARKQADSEGMYGAAEGVVSSFVGARIGLKPLPSLNSSGLNNVIKNVVTNSGNFVRENIVEGLSDGAIASGLQVAKNVEAINNGIDRGVFDGVQENAAGEIGFAVGMGILTKGGKSIVNQSTYKTVLNAISRQPKEAVDAKIGEMIVSGKLSPKEAVEIGKNIEEQRSLDSQIPPSIEDNSIRAEISDKIKARNDLKNQLSTVNEAFHAPIKEQIKQIDQEILGYANGNPPVSSAPELSIIESPAPGKRLFNEPNPEAAVIENEFKVSKGINTPEPAKITKLDEDRSKKIADEYEKLVDNPDDPEVQKAYQAMADETMEQFNAIDKSGVKVEIWTGKGEPYKNSEEMIKDVRDNKHMYIFSTEEGFGDTPITDKQREQNALLRDSGFKDVNGKPLLINDVFRFVHDYFGHTRLGNSFGAIGEENAWNVHARMYSPLARRAMTTETRGQNSWVNFNQSYRNPDGTMKKKGEEGYVPPSQRPFADQKMALLPEEFSNIEDSYSLKSGDNIQVALDKSIDKASQSLSKAGIKFNVVDGSTGDQSAEAARGNQGLFVSEDGTIIIDKSKLANDIEAGLVVWHEASHPVMNIIRNTNKPLYDKVVIGLRKAARTNEGIFNAIEWAESQPQYDNIDTQNDEAVVETIGRINSGLIDISKLDTGLRQSIIDFVNNIAKYLGIDPILNDTDLAAFKKTVGQVADALKTGRDIAEVVGKENVKDFKASNDQAQAEGLFTKKDTKVFKSLSDVAKYVEEWANKNRLFDKSIEDVSDSEVVNKFADHVLKEIKAWESSNKDYVGFYDEDIPNRLNPELQRFAELRYGRKLNAQEVSLYHIVSAFASPSADPVFDSSKGLEVFDMFMKKYAQDNTSARPSGYTSEQATIWDTINGKRVDTGKPKFDEQGKPVMKQIAKAYAIDSLDKMNRVIDHFNGDFRKAVDWLESIHSYEDLSDVLGLPTKGPKALKEHEYLAKNGGGFGVFAITGPKLGSYILNRVGEYSTVTKDMWYARTMARLAGENIVDKEGNVVKTPWDTTKAGVRKRKLADDAFRIVAKKLGTTPADVQQKIWDFEKRLYEKLGAVEKSGYASEGFMKKATELEPSFGKAQASVGNRDIITETGKKPRTLSEDIKVYHYSRSNDLSADTIDPFRTGQSQLKKRMLGMDKEDLPSGFYTTLSPNSFYGKLKRNEGVPIVGEERNLFIINMEDVNYYDITEEYSVSDRIPQRRLKELKDKGYDIVVGRGMIGEPELIVLNKEKIADIKKANTAEKNNLLSEFGESRQKYTDEDFTVIKSQIRDQASVGNRDIINGFYSPIEDRINTFKQPKASVQKWKEIVGVKSDEAVYSGLSDWLGGMKPDRQLSKEEVSQFIKDNRIEINEVVKGKGGKMSQSQIDDVYNGVRDQLSNMDMIDDVDGDRNNPLDVWYNNPTDENYDTLGEFTEERGVDLNFIADAENDGTKFSQYQLPGGQNYKEVLITLPRNEDKAIAEYNKVRDELDEFVRNIDMPTEADKLRYAELSKKEKALQDKLPKNTLIQQGRAYQGTRPFRSSHFDEPNIITHLRMNTRTDADGKKVLFLEEVQSDWGQKGKREGFMKTSKDRSILIDEHKLVLKELDKINNEIDNKINTNIYKEDFKLLVLQKLELDKRSESLKNEIFKTTPSAPYVTNTNAWVKLGLKVALKEAVRQGADRIAWTTGEQQIERYDLSKSIKRVDFIRIGDNRYKYEALGLDGKRIAYDDNGTTSLQEIEDMFGKDIAEKVKADKAGDLRLQGDGLKVGGKGMKAFYGDANNPGIVGNVAKALVKELTGRDGSIIESKMSSPVNQDVIDRYNRARQYGNVPDALAKEYEQATGLQGVQPAIDITPELKAAVQGGMPQFSVGNRSEDDLRAPGEGKERNRALASKFGDLDPKTQAKIDEDAVTYFQRTNKQTEKAVQEFIDGRDLIDMADYVLSNPDIPEVSKVWMAAEVANRLNAEIAAAQDQNLKDALTEKQAAIYNEFAKKATSLGQAVQAFIAFKKDSNAVEFFLPKVLRQLKDAGVDNITDIQKAEIVNLLKDVNNSADGLPKDKAIIKLSHYLAGITPLKPIDVLQSIWYAKILSGITTQSTNFFANVFNTMFELPAVGLRLALKTGNPMALAYGIKGFGSGVFKGSINAADIVKSGVRSKEADKYFSESPLEYFTWSKWLGKKGEVLDKIPPLNFGAWKYVGRILAATDAFFSTANQEAIANMLAYAQTSDSKPGMQTFKKVNEILGNTKQNINNAQAQAIAEGFKPGTLQNKRRVLEIVSQKRGDDITSEADAIGKRITMNYDPEGWTKPLFDAVVGLQKSIPPIKMVIPFARIVANLTENALNYTPAGLVKAVTGNRNPFNKADKLSNDERIDLVSKFSIGMGALVLLATKTGEDDDDWFEITAGGSNDPQKKYELQKGEWRPYTITLKDGTKYNYKDWPIAGILAGIGHMRDAKKYSFEDSTQLGLYATGFFLNFYDKSLLSGLQDFFGILDVKAGRGKYAPDTNMSERFEKYAAQQVKSVAISNLSQQSGRLYSELVTGNPQRDARTFMEVIYRDIPVINDGIRPIIDVFGDPVKYNTTERLLPVMSEPEGDKIIKWLNENKLFVGVAKKRNIFDIDTMTERPMTDDEYYQYKKLSGQKTKQWIIEFMDMIKDSDREISEQSFEGAKSAARDEAYVELFIK
jgi:hypothetical protein